MPKAAARDRRFRHATDGCFRLAQEGFRRVPRGPRFAAQ